MLSAVIHIDLLGRAAKVVLDKPSTYDEALQACEAMGGDLLTIWIEGQNNQLVSALGDYSNLEATSILIGLSYTTATQWPWSSTGESDYSFTPPWSGGGGTIRLGDREQLAQNVCGLLGWGVVI